jgi:hypothetical protein
VLAVASLGGNNAMKEMLLAQQEASNQRSYYQAKLIREHLNRGNKLVLETQLAEPSALKGAERPYFDYAEVLLQIAIVCSSVSILAGSRPMFWFSSTLAVLESLLTVNGFLLLLRVPFFHGH